MPASHQQTTHVHTLCINDSIPNAHTVLYAPVNTCESTSVHKQQTLSVHWMFKQRYGLAVCLQKISTASPCRHTVYELTLSCLVMLMLRNPWHGRWLQYFQGHVFYRFLLSHFVLCSMPQSVFFISVSMNGKINCVNLNSNITAFYDKRWLSVVGYEKFTFSTLLEIPR